MVLNYLLRCDLSFVQRLRFEFECGDRLEAIRRCLRILADPILCGDLSKHASLKLDIFIRYLSIMKKRGTVELLEQMMCDFFKLLAGQFSAVYTAVSRRKKRLIPGGRKTWSENGGIWGGKSV